MYFYMKKSEQIITTQLFENEFSENDSNLINLFLLLGFFLAKKFQVYVFKIQMKSFFNYFTNVCCCSQQCTAKVLNLQMQFVSFVSFPVVFEF